MIIGDWGRIFNGEMCYDRCMEGFRVCLFKAETEEELEKIEALEAGRKRKNRVCCSPMHPGADYE